MQLVGLTVTEFNAELHYKDICSWWTKKGWPSIPLEMLSQRGFVVSLNTLNIAAGWLYETDSKISLMEFMVGNPDVPHELRGEALNMLISKIKGVAKECGFKKVFSSVVHGRLVERYQRHGFEITDKNATNMIGSL